jgi:hypothetical protein
MVIDTVKGCGIETNSKIVEVPMRIGETPNSVVVAKKPYPIEYRDIKDVIKEAVEYYRDNQWR